MNRYDTNTLADLKTASGALVQGGIVVMYHTWSARYGTPRVYAIPRLECLL